MSRFSLTLLALGLSGMLGATAAQAADEGSLESALTQGKVNADLRLRYENVDQDNALKQADAVTVRTLLGYTTKTWNGLSAFVEMENVSALVDDYSEHAPPVKYSVIADPDGGELNQWGIRYTGIDKLTATIGRSKLIFDNARWVGNVGWRQNEQTYDGYFLKYAPTSSVTLNYAHITNVNSIFFTNLDLKGDLINAHWVVSPALMLSAYGYLLNYELETAATPDADTYGLRANGTVPLNADFKLLYAAEYAAQSADTPAGNFDADYLLGELGLGYKTITVKLGYELLGSDDGAYAVQTPLATLHAFNGWNDQFLVTPNTGLKDSYASVGGKIEKFSWLAVYHEFKSDEGSLDYGTEWNLQLTRPITDKLDAGIKYGAYHADDRPVDTDKLWVWTEFKF